MHSYRSLVRVTLSVIATLCITIAPARAAEINFATLHSYSGLPSIVFDLSNGALTSLNLPNGLPVGDPFNPSAPTTYDQNQPGPVLGLPSLFTLAPVAPFFTDGAGVFAYGAGNFDIALNGGVFALPFVSAAFNSAVLALAPDFSTGLFFNQLGTTFSGPGFGLSGLFNSGSFAFALANPIIYRAVTGAPIAIGYEITSGFLVASDVPVPEPASMLLLGTGIAGMVARRRRARA